MTFTNIEVALADLPTFEDVAYQNLDPSYARMVCAVTVVVESFLLLTALIILALVEFPDDARLPISMVGAATIVIFILLPLYRFKAARVIGFAIRDHDLIDQIMISNREADDSGGLEPIQWQEDEDNDGSRPHH